MSVQSTSTYHYSEEPSNLFGPTSTAKTWHFHSEDMQEQVRELQAEAEEKLPRGAFPWLDTEDVPPGKQQVLTMTAEEIAKDHGIPMDALQDFLKARISKLEACRSLPFTILLVLSFASTATIHDAAPTIRAVEDSLAFDVDDNANFAVAYSDLDGQDIGFKGIVDVHSHLDFWFWMQGLVGLIFQEGAGFHEGADESAEPFASAAEDGFIQRRDRGFWLFYNRIVGGLRLVQERDSEIDCVQPLRAMRLPEIKCVGGYDYNLDPEVGLPANRAETTINPEREQWLYVADDADYVYGQVLQMEAEQWLDRQTRKIEIVIPVYNAEFGVHTLVRVNFYFSRGGHIWKQILPSSQFAESHTNWKYFISDGLWIMCLMYMGSSEVVEIVKLVKRGGIGELSSYVQSIWNVIDWLTVVGGFAIILTFAQSLQMASELNAALAAVGELDPIFQQAEFRDAVHDYTDILEENVEYYRFFRRTMFLYPYIIIARLFKSFSKQPKLALVTRTLQLSAPDLVHFGIVCVAVFTVFMIFGIVIFGREVRNFTEAPRAAVACFRVMLGDIDWAELSAVGRDKATVWLWLYTILVVLLMLNMVLAIIMDNYSVVKEEAANGTTVWEDAVEVIDQWRGVRQGGLAPLEEILAAVESIVPSHKTGLLSRITAKISRAGTFSEGALEKSPTSGRISTSTSTIGADSAQTLIKVQTLMQAYKSQHDEGMTEEQATSIITEAIEFYYDANKHEPEIDDVLRLIRQVKARVKKMIRMTIELHQVRDRAAVEELEWFSKPLDEYLDIVQQQHEAAREEIDRLRAKRVRIEDQLLQYPPKEVFAAVEEEEGAAGKEHKAAFIAARDRHRKQMNKFTGGQKAKLKSAVSWGSSGITFGSSDINSPPLSPMAPDSARSGRLLDADPPPPPPLRPAPAAEDEPNPDAAWPFSDDEQAVVTV